MMIVKCSSSFLRMKIPANMYILCEVAVHENVFNCRKEEFNNNFKYG